MHDKTCLFACVWHSLLDFTCVHACACTATNGFLCDCQRAAAPSSPLSNKLGPRSKVVSSLSFVVFPLTRFAHQVFIININKSAGHPLFSLPSHLENGPNYWGHQGDVSVMSEQDCIWLGRVTRRRYWCCTLRYKASTCFCFFNNVLWMSKSF